MSADLLASITSASERIRGGRSEDGPGWDLGLLVTVFVLVALGLVMLYSASAVMAAQRMGEHYTLLIGQVQKVVLGLGAMFVAMQVDYRWYKRLIYPILGVTVLLLIAVTIPQIGVMQNGARRWINLFGFSFQPAELTKLTAVMFLAYSISKKGKKMGTLGVGLVFHLVMISMMVGLLMLQPDFGTAVMLLGIMMILLFVSGARLTYLILLTFVGAFLGFMAITGSEYRMKRILAFLDPWSHRQDIGYQISESLIAIGSAGLGGRGLGAGAGKLGYVPELWNDFIATIIAEELGILGIVAVVTLFLLLLWRGLKIAFEAVDSFGMYLAFGLTSLFLMQASLNLFVVTGMLPTKGLTLPFVSFGGTSMIVGLFSVGVLLNISRRQPDYWELTKESRRSRREEKMWEKKRQRILKRRKDLR